MRRAIILVAAVFVTGLAHAQKLPEGEVPATVKKAFVQKFPNAKSVKWEKEDDAAIEANFKIGKEENSATFDPAGNWLETESAIKKDKLPGAVRATLTKEFPSYKIEEVEKVEKPDQEFFYEVEMEKKEVTYEVRISPEGKILKKEEERESKEKNEKN